MVVINARNLLVARVVVNSIKEYKKIKRLALIARRFLCNG